MAFSAYRMTYAAIWDWRFNHIPLNRGVPFDFANPELAHAVFTHRVGWGSTGAGYGAEKGAGGFGHHHDNGMMGGAGTNGAMSRKPVGSGVAGGRADDMV